MSNRQRLLADNDENCSKVSSKSIHVLIPYLFFCHEEGSNVTISISYIGFMI